MKKSRLNELAEETRRKERLIAKTNDDNTDAVRLTPEQLADEMAYIQQLKDEMKRIDEDLTEAEAKNRLYYLLGERTRWGGGGPWLEAWRRTARNLQAMEMACKTANRCMHGGPRCHFLLVRMKLQLVQSLATPWHKPHAAECIC
jgi:hypothetical protein